MLNILLFIDQQSSIEKDIFVDKIVALYSRRSTTFTRLDFPWGNKTQKQMTKRRYYFKTTINEARNTDKRFCWKKQQAKKVIGALHLPC